MDLSLANRHSINVLRLSKALCCSLWLSVNTATSANLPWFIFTGFKDNPSFPEEQPFSSFPKGSALDGRPYPPSPSLGRGRPRTLGPRAPLRDRQRTLAATSGAPPSHTRPSHERQTVAGHLRAAPYLRFSSVTIPLRDQTTLCGFPAIIWLARPHLLLALARRHNQPLMLKFFTSARLPPAQPLVDLGEADHRTPPDNPTYCGQSQVPRSPA